MDILKILSALKVCSQLQKEVEANSLFTVTVQSADDHTSQIMLQRKNTNR